MGTIQRDEDNVIFRSRKPDEGSELTLQSYFKAGLRDSTVENLVKKCNDLELGIKVQKAWLQHKAHYEEHQERMEKLQQWDEHVDDYKWNYDGESNIHLPLPIIVLKTFHARMYQALFAIDP